MNANYTQRNVAIDILRALTMVTMIFVNDFWNVNDIPHWLEHAKRGEDFMGLSDVVFPCFLFVVGMSIPFAIERRYSKGYSGESTIGHILSRTFALLVMGVFIVNSEARLSTDVCYSISTYWFLMVIGFLCIWNQYPATNNNKLKWLFTSLKVLGVIILLFLAITYRSEKGSVFNASWWGILGLIGWSYLICSFIYVYTRDRLKYLLPIWAVFVIVCMLGTKMNEANAGATLLSLPRTNFYSELLGILHIGNGASPAFTMGGIILSVLFVRFQDVSIRKKLLWAGVGVVVFVIAGFIARHFWIISKLSATPTWIFYVTAISIGAYAIILWLVDKGKASWFNIIKPAGTATLTTYMIPYVSYGLARVTGINLPDWFTHGFMSIINCLSFALIIVLITGLLGRIHIKLKI